MGSKAQRLKVHRQNGICEQKGCSACLGPMLKHLSNKGGHLAGTQKMEIQNRSLICGWFLAKQTKIVFSSQSRPKCWHLNI